MNTIILKDTDDISVKVVVSPIDKYTKMHHIKIATSVKDQYNKKELDVRSFSIYLSNQELLQLSNFLSKITD